MGNGCFQTLANKKTYYDVLKKDHFINKNKNRSQSEKDLVDIVRVSTAENVRAAAVRLNWSDNRTYVSLKYRKQA